MKHILEDHHKEHLRAVGISDPPQHLNIPEHEYLADYSNWERTLPNASNAIIHAKCLAHAATRQLLNAQPVVIPEPTKEPVTPKAIDLGRFPYAELRIIIAILLLILLGSIRGHCQFSKVNSVNFQNAGVNLSGAYFTYPFNINCNSNLTCAVSGNTLTINASSTAATAWSAITAATNSNAGTFAMSGNTLDLAAATLVKMRVAAGLTSSVNGDLGYDTTNKNWHIWANAVDNFIAVIPVSASVTNGHLATWSLSSSVLTLNDGGPVPATLANVSHKWLNSYTASTGVFTQTQPACGDLSDSGTLCTSSATLAVNTTATAHNFFTAYNSTTGAFTKAQPACSDLSDSSGGCTMSTTGAGDISGTLPSVTVTNGSHITNSSIPNSGLANTATTVSGQTCTLGSTCTITRICADGLGDGLNAMTAGTYLVTNCYNDFGATYTITNIRCFTDNNGTSTLNAANDAAGGLLTGAVTCTNAYAAGTQSGTTTIATSHWINFTFVADGTSKRATFEVTVTR